MSEMTEWEKNLEARANKIQYQPSARKKEQDPLSKTGTQYQFFTELLEKYMTAHERVLNTYKTYRSDGDKILLARIEAFLKILKEEMQERGKMEMEEWGIRNVVESLPRPKVTDEEKQYWSKAAADKRKAEAVDDVHTKPGSQGGEKAGGDLNPA